MTTYNVRSRYTGKFQTRSDRLRESLTHASEPMGFTEAYRRNDRVTIAILDRLAQVPFRWTMAA